MKSQHQTTVHQQLCLAIERDFKKKNSELEQRGNEKEDELFQANQEILELKSKYELQQNQFLAKREQMNEQHFQNEKIVEDIINRLSGSHGSDCKKVVETNRIL